MTKQLCGENGVVKALQGCQIEWANQNGQWKMTELPGTEFTLEADLVLLAMGFEHVEHDGLVKELELELDKRGNIMVKHCQSSTPWVFAAGDTVSGASLVVSAINSGRQAASAINRWLATNC